MVRRIVKNTKFLAQVSREATKKDSQIIEDLLDTLRANRDYCVGMAANMIGEKKRIIVENYLSFILYRFCRKNISMCMYHIHPINHYISINKKGVLYVYL